MKKVLTRLSRFAALALATTLAALGARADIEKTNPVTGQSESYVNNFLGTNSSEWNAAGNWNSGSVPFVSGGVYASALVDGKTVTSSADIDLWHGQIGAYSGASITIPGITKIQATGGCKVFLTADRTSKITINAFRGNQLQGSASTPIELTSAQEGGITWNCGLTSTTDSSAPFHYYIDAINNGSVVYTGNITVANDQVIKQVNIKLTGNSQVSSKTLVTFGSETTKTFTADAAIKVYGTDGTTLVETVNLAEVKTASTLTASDPVGTCELVQTSTGIVLYYVDGDPSAVVEKTYTPSININFTTSGTALTTAADVGLSGYAVPGTAWDNLVGNNGTLSTVHKIDSTATQSTVSGASVTISGTRGYWNCSSLAAASDLRQGYIDENANYQTPTITVSGIPYDQYKVVVYTATDEADTAFGYVTVNGTNYTYVNNELTEGTTTWGASGAANTANALAEGVNVLVSPVVSGATLTIVGHKMTGARGCIAAVQIVKVEQQVGENDLLIELDGDRTYTFDEAKAYSGTVYVTGSGTLTFAGTASTAGTLNIGPAASVNMVGSSLTPAAVTGNGTVVYDGAQPSTTLGFDNSANWQGTVWVKNVGSGGETSNTTVTLGSDTSTAANNTINNWGNANSRVKFTNVRGHVSACNCAWTLVLEDDGDTKAWYNNNGWTGSSKDPVFAKLAGDGTFYDTYNDGCRQNVTFTDASEFTGTFNVGAKRIGIGGTNTADNNQDYRGTIEIVSGAVATIASGKTWTSATGFRVNGTLNVDGTLSCSASTAVSGSGTVVFTGRVPTPVDGENETKWWKNAAWTGTVWIKSSAISALNSNLYGNEGSTLKFTGVTGYFAQNHVNTVPIELENSGSTAAFNYNNGWGGELLTFSELKGTGTLQTSSAGDGGTIWVKKWDAFTGVMNLGKKQVVMGGSEPAHGNVNRGGKLVIAEGAVVTNLNATTSWTAGGGIEVNGTFAASDRTAWADGTAMTVNSTGILNMYGSGLNDTGKSFANVTGTGTIWYSQTTTANDKWSALPSSAANMFANTLSVSNDNVNAGVIITMNGASDVVTTNANISGTGYFRSDWGTGAYRGFLALQSKNTTWSGTFGSSSRIKKFIVAGVDGATDRTLTLAGTQSSTIPLTVESLGSVNITGTYLGATTVAGTIGGTGTLTGNLTFSDGATFKAFASDENGLAVSGTVTTPGSGTVTVDVSAISESITSSGVTLISGGVSEVGTFAVDSAYRLAVDGSASALKVYPAVTYVAEYNGVQYETVQEAINAAEQAGGTYDDVTILDENATCPAGYYVDTENSNALTKYQAAIVKTDSSKVYFKTPQLAFDDISANANLLTYMQGYTCVEVYYGTGTEILINASAAIWNYGQAVKIRCLNGSTVSVSTTATESTLTAGTADENGIVTYSSMPVATTYVWAGGTTQGPWSNPKKWKVGTLGGADATRKPGALDTVQIGDGAKVSDIVGSLSVAALQVSGTVTFIGGGTLTSASAITLGANDSIVITGTLSPVPTTSVANSYVKETGDTTKTYAVDAYNTVTFTGATATRTDDLENAIKDGDTITFTLDAGEGYAVDTVTASSGEVTESNGVYSYTVTENATITVTTVSTAVTFSDVEFDYYIGYGSAKSVTATVTGEVAEGTAWTLTVGGTEYAGGVYDSATGKVTWTPANGIQNLSAGQALSYSIAATGGSTGTLANQQTTVGNVVDGWIAEDATHSGTGTWSPAISYTESVASVSDATFTAASASAGNVVTIATTLKFGDCGEKGVDVGPAQAAIKIDSENDAYVFKVWTRADASSQPAWATITNFEPDPAVQYAVTVVFDYTAGTYTVNVGSTQLAAGATTAFLNALAGASSVSAIEFNGAGEFASLAGSYVSAGGITETVGTATVPVADTWVAAKMAGKTVAEARALLAPASTVAAKTTSSGATYNYFACYALGLDPEDDTSAPLISAASGEAGKLTFSLANITVPDGITVTATLKSSATPDGDYAGAQTAQAIGTPEGTQLTGGIVFDPAAMEGAIEFLKFDLDIGATVQP